MHAHAKQNTTAVFCISERLPKYRETWETHNIINIQQSTQELAHNNRWTIIYEHATVSKISPYMVKQRAEMYQWTQYMQMKTSE